ncbi:RNA-binding protein 24-A-like protein isoform X2 [Tanacetum coccineum]
MVECEEQRNGKGFVLPEKSRFQGNDTVLDKRTTIEEPPRQLLFQNRQYPYHGATVGSTNDGMITATGAAATAVAFYPYLKMAEGGHGNYAMGQSYCVYPHHLYQSSTMNSSRGYAQEYGTPISLAATPAMQPACVSHSSCSIYHCYVGVSSWFSVRAAMSDVISCLAFTKLEERYTLKTELPCVESDFCGRFLTDEEYWMLLACVGSDFYGLSGLGSAWEIKPKAEERREKKVPEDYRVAVINAIEAGFDGIEIHKFPLQHGFILNIFERGLRKRRETVAAKNYMN